MGNTQPLAQRLGFEAPKVVQKEKYRIVYSHYSIKGKRPIMEDYLNVRQPSFFEFLLFII